MSRIFFKLNRRLRALFRKSEMESELDAELQFHLEKETEQNIARGMNPKAARLAALRSFGGVDQVKEQSRDVRGVRFIEELVQDLRYSLRILIRKPAFHFHCDRYSGTRHRRQRRNLQRRQCCITARTAFQKSR